MMTTECKTSTTKSTTTTATLTNVTRSSRGARGLTTPVRQWFSGLAACGALAFAVTFPVQAQVQVQIQAVPVKPAVVNNAAKAAVKNVAKEAAKEAKAAPIDAKLEKEIAGLEGELKKQKKGTPKYDVIEVQLKRKQAELKRKETIAKAQKNAVDRQKQLQEEYEQRIKNGASLETSSDVDMLIEKARVYVEEKNYGAACTLWQHILDGPTALTDRRPSALAVKQLRGEQPARRGNFVFRPVRDLIESELAALPPEGLREYRIKADINARGMLGSIGSANEESVLHRIVQRYFMSSVGDDVAYRLACIRLDAYDFLGARELFRKVLAKHPDPSVPRVDLLIRATLASARAGDSSGANDLFKEIESTDAAVPRGLVAMVREEVARGALASDTPTVATGWPMALGNFARNGIMPGVPGAPVRGSRLWAELPFYDAQYNFKIKQVITTNNSYGRPKGPNNRASIATRWEKGKWMPTSQVLLRGDLAFIKTHDSLRALDMSTGKRAWKDVEQKGIGIPAGARVYPRVYYSSSTNSDRPISAEEVAMFGDRSAKAMALIDDTLLHIEGRFWIGGRAAQYMMWVNGQQKTLAFSDVLCAVDSKTGGVKWRFNQKGQASHEDDLRILAAPVKSNNNLIVPVAKNSGELHLYGIDFKTGKRVFDTFLCKGAQSNPQRWEQAGVALNGGEAYIATGEGVIFAIDAVMGQVKWATKYEQSKPKTAGNSRMIGMGYRGQVDLPGWDDDVIIPHGNKLIVLPSDSQKLLAYSRIDGKFLYHSPKDDMRYCLGVRGNRLYVAGNSKVRCYDLPTGKLADETTKAFGDCFGRGALTANGIYMPTKEAIVRLDVESLDVLGRMPIAAKSKDPIGNLFTDGNRLVASGLDRTYALVDGELKIVELTKRIEASDNGDARFERAFLQSVVGKHAAAVDDLRVAIRLLPDGDKKTEASRQLLVALLATASELKDKPAEAHAIFDEAENVARPQGDLARVWLARGNFHDKRSEFDDALDLFLKAAQDTGASLVTVKDSDGRLREARASHAGATAIREMLRKRGEVVRKVLMVRGQEAMKPYRELALIERNLEDNPGSPLPQIAEVQELSGNMAAHQAKLKTKKEQAKQWAERAENFKVAIEMEKANPGGKLKELETEYAGITATITKVDKELVAIDSEIGLVKQQIDITRREMTGTLQRLNDVQTDRVKHAAKLLRIAAMYPDIDITMDAKLMAADHLFRGEHFERGELILRNLAISPNRRHAASGIAAMAQAYDAKGWKRQSRLEWSRLLDSFADQKISWRGEDKDAVYIAKEKVGNQSADVEKSFRSMPDPPYKLLWGDPVSGRYHVIPTTNDTRSQFLEDHVLLLNTSRNRLVCRDVATGEDLWQQQLNKTGVSGSSSSNGRLIKYNNYVFPGGKLMSDGHVGVLWSPKGISVFGLVSGKTLWESKPFSENTNTNNWYYPYDNPIGPVDAGNGVLVEKGMSASRGVEQIRATDLATGSVRWVTDFDGESIMGVKAAGGYVNVFLANGRSTSYFNEVVICDLESGQQLGRIKLGNRSRYYPFTWTRFGLMSVESSAATLYELPSGKKKWTTKLTGKVRTSTSYMRARMIDDENCFVMASGLHVINMRAGKIKMSAGDPSMGKYLQDGAVTPDGKEMYVFGYTYDSKTKVNSRQMSIIDVKSGKKKLSTTIGPYTSSRRDAESIIGSGNLVPIVIREAPVMNGKIRRYSNNYDLAFFRKSDGKRLDVKLPKVGSRFNGELWPIVRGNVLLIMSTNGISAYVKDSSIKDFKYKEYVAPKKPKPEKKDPAKGAQKNNGKNALVPAIQVLPGIRIAPARIQVKPAPVKKPGSVKKPVPAKKIDSEKK